MVEEFKTRVDETLIKLRSISENLTVVNCKKANDDLDALREIVATLCDQFGTLIDVPSWTDREINYIALKMYLDCLNYNLGQIYDRTYAWKSRMRSTDREDLVIFMSKLDSITEMFEPAMAAPVDDLFFLPPDHERWKSFSSVLTIKQIGDPVKMREKFEDFFRNVAVGNAFVSDGMKASNETMRSLRTTYMMMYYGIRKSRAVRKTKLFYAKPNIEVACTVWSLLDTNLCSAMLQLILPPIKTNKRLFIPALHPVLDINTTHEKYSPSVSFTTVPQMGKRSIPVRLLCNSSIQKLKEKEGSIGPELLLMCCSSIRKEPTHFIQYSSLVFHIHGGGFIAMSSASHENYTRKIANQTNLPVLSIDYRLAPENPFPAALDDVWQTYLWILHHAKDSLGVLPNKLVIVGDSAGGNLALALCLKCIEKGVRLPTGLVLAYPAVNLDKSSFSPSLIYTLEDLLVPHTFLKLCLDSYIQDPYLDPATNPFLSPLKAPEEWLRRLPPIRMLVGTRDPLHDDVLRLGERLYRAENDVKLVMYEGVPHGALNLDLKFGVKECGELVKQISLWVNELCAKH
jgi:hormone-sensitive lipase